SGAGGDIVFSVGVRAVIQCQSALESKQEVSEVSWHLNSTVIARWAKIGKVIHGPRHGIDDKHRLEIKGVSWDDVGMYACGTNNQAPGPAQRLIVQDVPSAAGRAGQGGRDVCGPSTRVGHRAREPRLAHHALRLFVIEVVSAIWCSSPSGCGAPLVLISQVVRRPLVLIVELRRPLGPHLEPVDGGDGGAVCEPALPRRASASEHVLRVPGVCGELAAVGRSLPSLPSALVLTQRESPRGVVRDIGVDNVTQTSVNVSWVAPPADEVHGELVGYRISYQKKNDQILLEKYVHHPMRSVVLRELVGNFTPYVLTVQVDNGGNTYGPPVQVSFNTWEGASVSTVGDLASAGAERTRQIIVCAATTAQAPARPPAHVASATKASMCQTIAQQQGKNLIDHRTAGQLRSCNDERSCGNYSLNNKENLSIIVRGNYRSCTMEKLRAHTTYLVRVVASTSKGQGEVSDVLTAVTDVKGPGAPSNVSANSLSPHSVAVAWRAPTRIYGTIDFYYVQVWRLPDATPTAAAAESSGDAAEDEEDEEAEEDEGKERAAMRVEEPKKLVRTVEVAVVTSDGGPAQKQELVVGELAASSRYEARVAGVARSMYREQQQYRGDYSPAARFTTPEALPLDEDGAGMNVGVVVGVVCTVVLLLVALVIYAFITISGTQRGRSVMSLPVRVFSKTKLRARLTSTDAQVGRAPTVVVVIVIVVCGKLSRDVGGCVAVSPNCVDGDAVIICAIVNAMREVVAEV
ncbi:PREDICTED: uncharacterized protein LOC106816781, partial [Priapulus caudatus]|uniref:Uncharacterized protein LOC106816781 n=1 Tax=Priapulus caudatus TaxID=37621 RepID=A0ABM1EXH0_PRICU